VVVVDAVYDKVRAEFAKRGAHFLSAAETAAAGGKIILQPGNRLNVDIVGQSVVNLAKLFGITVPTGSRVLIGEVSKVGSDEPWSYEKLSPLLAMYRAPNFDAAVDTASQLVDFAGAGHTSVLYTSPQNTRHIKAFESKVNTCRMLVRDPPRARPRSEREARGRPDTNTAPLALTGARVPLPQINSPAAQGGIGALRRVAVCGSLCSSADLHPAFAQATCSTSTCTRATRAP
jgi:hypothetical protein